MSERRFLVSIIGGHKCSEELVAKAALCGRIVAEAGAVLITGGLGGIMEAASRGASENGGLTLGMIPGTDKDRANAFVDIVINTGLGNSRNTLVASTADLVVAFPGQYGTLSEIGFALNAGIPVFGLDTWDIRGVEPLEAPDDLRRVLKEHMERV
jgi:hypothetical protein